MTVLPSHLQYNSEIGELAAKPINEMEHKYFHRFDFFTLQCSSLMCHQKSFGRRLIAFSILWADVWCTESRIERPCGCLQVNVMKIIVMSVEFSVIEHGWLLSMAHTVVYCVVMLEFEWKISFQLNNHRRQLERQSALSSREFGISEAHFSLNLKILHAGAQHTA